MEERRVENTFLSEDSVSVMLHNSSLADGKPSSTSTQVDRITEPIRYEKFFLDYLFPNKPCIFGSYLTEGWPSRNDWVDDRGLPNIQFLREHFGDVTVPVADCEQVQYDAQPKEDMLLRDYLQYWEECMGKGQRSDKRCLYMKDMHFTRDCPSYKAYETPLYFTSDWLNEFWDTRTDCEDKDDYRFLYMGPAGSWTPFHADVFRSYSWSANVCGSKKWILVPPGQEVLLRDRLGNLPYDVTSCDFEDTKHYPSFKEGSYTPIEVIQSAGEVIFVPSGWHHQVLNLEETISINHNWFNGASISNSWHFLQSELSKVQTSISDCRDMEGWEQQCQLILKASSGMDYHDFFQLLVNIARRRLKLISGLKDKMMKTSSNGTEKALKARVASQSNSCMPNDDLLDGSGDNVDHGNLDKNSAIVQHGTLLLLNLEGTAVLSESQVDCDDDARAYSVDDLDPNHTYSSGGMDTSPDHEDELSFTDRESPHWMRSLTYWYAVYDLHQLVRILDELLNNADSRLLDISFHEQIPEEVIKEITDTLSKVKWS